MSREYACADHVQIIVVLVYELGRPLRTPQLQVSDNLETLAPDFPSISPGGSHCLGQAVWAGEVCLAAASRVFLFRLQLSAVSCENPQRRGPRTPEGETDPTIEQGGVTEAARAQRRDEANLATRWLTHPR